MKNVFFLLAALVATHLLYAQVTVTVVKTDGVRQDISLDATGEIYFNTASMIIMTGTETGNIVTFSLDDVAKVLFDGSNVNIHDVSNAPQISLFPNPSRNFFTVVGIGSEQQQLSVYNINGMQVLQGRYSDGEPVDISALPQGIYLVRVGMSFEKLIKY